MIITDNKDNKCSLYNLKYNILYEVIEESRFISSIKKGMIVYLLFKDKENYYLYDIKNKKEIIINLKDCEHLIFITFKEYNEFELEGFRNKNLSKIYDLEVGYIYRMYPSYKLILVLENKFNSFTFFDLDKKELFNINLLNKESFELNFKKLITELKILQS